MNHYPRLPGSFYDESDILRKVQQAGFARITSPDAVLACLLCRVSASLDPGITIPNSSLNYISALVGESGTGKSVAFRASQDLLPDIGTRVDGWVLGSGQGITATIVGKADDDGVCTVVNPRVLFLADEGEQMLKLGKNEGSITMSTIRTAWSGLALGQTNADKDRSRNVGSGQYRFALTIGLQPHFASELLTGVHAGDPQRFLFAGVTHPEQPDIIPPFPTPLDSVYLPEGTSTVLKVDPEVRRIIQEHRVKKQRREVIDDPLDSHRMLLTLKTAGLLAFLHGDDIAIHWWNMAVQVVEVSRNVRNHVRDLALVERQSVIGEKANTEVQFRTQVDEVQKTQIMESHIKTMSNFVKNKNRPVSHSDLQQCTSSKYRQVVPFDDALSEALRRGVIIQNGTSFNRPN